jgi:hypothetical protein
VKRIIIVIALILSVLIVPGSNQVNAADGAEELQDSIDSLEGQLKEMEPILVYSDYLSVEVQPIEVLVLKKSSLIVRPGQPITITYLINNYSTQWHYYVEPRLIGPVDGWIFTWIVLEEERGISTGDRILIPSGYYRTIEVTIYPIESADFRIQFFSTGKTLGEG